MRKRFIPVLLLDRQKRLVKTVQFGERTYIGDPFNVVRLFNEKEVDELCVLDIDAAADGRGPDFGFLSELASECFMPLAYGGGISSLQQCELLSREGIEKLVLGRAASRFDLVREIAGSIGSQAVAACVDVQRQRDGTHRVAAHLTASGATASPLDYCQRLEACGVGEIILQSVDKDGMRDGYDLELIGSIAPRLSVPLIALGGAGDLSHLAAAIESGASAAASGSAFTFIGRLRAVLINYPEREIASSNQPLGTAC